MGRVFFTFVERRAFKFADGDCRLRRPWLEPERAGAAAANAKPGALKGPQVQPSSHNLTWAASMVRKPRDLNPKPRTTQSHFSMRKADPSHVQKDMGIRAPVAR